jgi:transcriptional regulator with XRE-family HTH domain
LRSASETVSDIDIEVVLGNTERVERLYEQFGRRLRSLREDAGLTQDQVAERVSLKRTSITNIESGRQHIALHQLFLLAAAVGQSPAELLPDTGPALQELLPTGTVAALRASADDDPALLDFAMRVVSNDQTRRAPPMK